MLSSSNPAGKLNEGSPQFLQPLPEEVEVDEGSKMKLSVRVAGKPTPKLQWMFGTKPLKKTSRIEMRENNGAQELVIRNVTPDDEGVYSCLAVNKFGEAFCDCEVIVECKFALTYFGGYRRGGSCNLSKLGCVSAAVGKF